MSGDRIRIERDELFSAKVTRALAKERQLRRRPLPEEPPLSPLRRVLQSSLFLLPIAGGLAALVAWAILEPSFDDMAHIGGEVILVNTDPFDLPIEGALSLTVGAREVWVIPGQTRLEAGRDGQPAYGNILDVETGDWIETVGERLDDNRMVALGLRPATSARAEEAGQLLPTEIQWAQIAFFPFTAVLIAMALLGAEGLASRNFLRTVERLLLGTLLTVVFACLAFLPAGIVLVAAEMVVDALPGDWTTVEDIPPLSFLALASGRSIAWACLGAAAGLGMNLVRSTGAQLRNSVLGGALGGALGGIFFDPIDRFFSSASVFEQAASSRLVGLVTVGLCIGLFVALVERLAREAWVRVRTGPLAGKAFVLYRSPTVLGSAPQADVYLFKDAGIDPRHASIHRIGNRYEIEDMGSRQGTTVEGRPVRRSRLTSGDRIMLGGTVIEFDERISTEGEGKEGV